jgi:dCTP deaminase
MILGDRTICVRRGYGDLIIDPFDKENVNTSSYDVCLGEWYYKEATRDDLDSPYPFKAFFNPYSEMEVKRVWIGPYKAVSAPMYFAAYKNEDWTGINQDDFMFSIAPGATILAHTIEFIGGVKDITTKMQARSSIGRSLINVCACAGMGDVGYFNRWTMEITNKSQYNHIPLVVGRRIAQIVFDETTPVIGKYSDKGSYQAHDTLEQLKRDWEPSMMLPRLWKDRMIKPCSTG